jgi:xanthine dehydrogenase iron-sulfur cluster and FAD-binding subunit A
MKRMCEQCNGEGWIYRTNAAGVVGAGRCDCRKTKALQLHALTREEQIQLAIAAAEGAEDLEAMADYYAGKAGRRVITEALIRMCSSAEEVRYVVRRAVHCHTSWKRCGVPGLRQALISKYIARDGIQHAITEDYPDGLPSEIDGCTGYEAIEATELTALPAGAPQSQDPEIAEAVHKLAEKKLAAHDELLRRHSERLSEKRVVEKLEQMKL